MSEKNIDKLFEDGLGDFEMKPSDDLWGKIANDIGNTYVPDTGSISGSSTSSGASSGASTSAAVKGGTSLGAKLLTWKAAVVALAGAVGITTATVMINGASENEGSSNDESTLVIDSDQESNTNLTKVESIEADEAKESAVVQDAEAEGVDQDRNQKETIESTEKTINTSSVDNKESDKLDAISPSIASNLNIDDKKEAEHVDSEQSESVKEDAPAESDQIEGESEKNEKEDSNNSGINNSSKETGASNEVEIEKPSEDLNPTEVEDESNFSNDSNSESITDESNSNNESLKGEGNKAFDKENNEESVEKDAKDEFLDIPSLPFYFEPDTSGLLADSNLVMSEKDDSKPSIFPLIKPSFNPVGIYFGLGTSSTSTSFAHGEGVFLDKMYSIAFNGDLGYEFKNGLYVGTGLKLMSSVLESTDVFEFKIFEQNDEFRITDAYISNGLIETELSSEWILGNIELFENGTYYDYDYDDEEDYDWRDEFDWEELWEEEDFENEVEFLAYEFESQMDIVDRIDRAILPFHLGYNYSKGRWSCFGQLNAEIHSVNSWTRDIYFNNQLVESYQVQGITNRAFYGGSLGLGYHLNSGLEIRSSFDWSTYVNQHKHGAFEDIRLNNSALNLSLRWKI